MPCQSYRRFKKGERKEPKKNSEEAWGDKCYWHPRHYTHGSPTAKNPYLDFVRYMRWYANRSYLLRKIYFGCPTQMM
jgi:hypothetical protein